MSVTGIMGGVDLNPWPPGHGTPHGWDPGEVPWGSKKLESSPEKLLDGGPWMRRMFFFLLCRLVEEFRRTSAKKKPQKLFFFQDLCLSKKTTLGKKPKTTNNIGALSPFIFGISAPLGTRNRHHVPQKWWLEDVTSYWTGLFFKGHVIML